MNSSRLQMRLPAAWRDVALATTLLCPACGEDRTIAEIDAGLSDAGVDSSAPPVPSGGSSGVVDAAPQGGNVDANGFPDFFVDFVSNVPALRVIQESETGLLQIRMTSSNVEPLPDGGLRWFAELRNGLHDSWCHPEVVVRFLNDQGAVLWEGEAEVRSALHLAAGDIEPLLCVASEDTAVAWAVDLEAPAIDLNEVDAIGLHISGDVMIDTVPHPATPQIETIEVVEFADDGGVDYAVAGSLRGVAQQVSDTAVEVFAKNEQELIFEVLRAPKLEPPDGTLEPDELWQFQTFTSPDPIASFRALVSFEL